jgi:hypothetical protein
MGLGGGGGEQKKYLCSFLFVNSVGLHNVSILVKKILFFCNSVWMRRETKTLME